MDIDEITRNRNNKMRPEDVISFYRQALHNNRNWLEQAIREKDTEEIERISIFIERGERELSYAETRLTKHAPDVVDSAASVSISPASEVSTSQAESTPATTQVM